MEPSDLLVLIASEFNSSRFSRRIRREVEQGKTVWFSSPEDVILKKLAYYKEGESEKHIRDILGVLKIQQNLIDLDYLALWAAQLDLLDLWQQVLARSTARISEPDI